MRVLALTKYGRRGASSRIRTLQYLPFFDAAGIDVNVASLTDDGYLGRRYQTGFRGRMASVTSCLTRVGQLLRANDYDLVWLEKEAVPFLPALVEDRLLSRCPYVVDYDDAIFHRYDAHSSVVVRRVYGGKIDRVMRGARLVIAGNQYLADRASVAGASRVVIVPSVVDLRRYGPPSAPGSGPFTIGWIGSPSSEAQLELIRDSLELQLQREETRVVLVGARPSALDGLAVQHRRWSEETEVADVQSFDVGIMPLSDTPWRRGKCGYKIIQCMAGGKPVVASPVGVNRSIVESGSNGFLATSIDEWNRAFDRLRADQDLRDRFGRNAYATARDKYSLAIYGPMLVDLIRTSV